jgi:mono/diheme cytochrome c family protein
MNASIHRRQRSRQRPSYLLLAGAAGLAAAWLLPASGMAQETAAERGLAITQQWCSVCHAETAVETGPNMELSFEELVVRPGRDGTRLRALMDEDHFPMTTFRLFADEKDDVVAYLVRLRRQHLTPENSDFLVETGSALLEQNCAQCHAVGVDADSPLQTAPPFQTVARAYDPEVLAEGLAEGIVTGHADMPEHAFEPDEIDAILAYLYHLRGQ